MNSSTIEKRQNYYLKLLSMFIHCTWQEKKCMRLIMCIMLHSVRSQGNLQIGREKR